MNIIKIFDVLDVWFLGQAKFGVLLTLINLFLILIYIENKYEFKKVDKILLFFKLNVYIFTFCPTSIINIIRF